MKDTTGRAAQASDRLRQGVVVVSMVLAIAGALVGSGALGGTPIQEAAGGALSADGTLIAPAGPAFSIWSVIYVGLVCYTGWQLRPSLAASPRQRLLGYPMAGSLLLNAAWILSVQYGQLGLSVVMIILLLAVLVVAFRICLSFPGHGPAEAVLVDGVIGLYLGWVCVATAANITAALKAAGFDGWGVPAELWAVVVLSVAGLVGVAVAVTGRGRISPTLSLCWGLAWVAVSRVTGALQSTPTAIAALLWVAIVAVATILLRLRRRTVDAADARGAESATIRDDHE